MASSLTLGSDNVSPTTTTGRALATFVKSFGPSLAMHSLDASAADRHAVAAQQNAVQLAILERLDRIVQLLEHKPA